MKYELQHGCTKIVNTRNKDHFDFEYSGGYLFYPGIFKYADILQERRKEIIHYSSNKKSFRYNSLIDNKINVSKKIKIKKK